MPRIVKSSKPSKLCTSPKREYINYGISNWSDANQQDALAQAHREDEYKLKIIKEFHPKDIVDLIFNIEDKLHFEFEEGDSIVYIYPTYNEVLDVYNAITGVTLDYETLTVTSKFKNIDEVSKEYFSILDAIEKLRIVAKQEEKALHEQINREAKASHILKTYSEIQKEVFSRCKVKFNPLFKMYHDRMRAYSREAKIHFMIEGNLKCPPEFDFFIWSKLRDNYITWQDFSFSDFSPYMDMEKIRYNPIDTSPDEEDIIFRALNNGSGDQFGY